MIPLYRPGKPSAAQRNLITLPGLLLNNPADSPTDTYEVNAIVPTAAIDTSIDSSPSDNGSIVSPAKRLYYLLRFDGVIRAPTRERLEDKKVALAAATDPALLSKKNPTTLGFVAMDFDTFTLDTANFGTGIVASRFMVRPKTPSLPIDSIFQGLGAFFSIDFLVADPRRVFQTTSTLVGAGTATNKGNDAADVSLSIAMAGAGNAAFTIQRVGAITGTKALVLNLAGLANGNVVTVDMKTGTIQLNGVDAPAKYVSGDYWDLDPGANTITITNGTNATATTIWRHSWVR